MMLAGSFGPYLAYSWSDASSVTITPKTSTGQAHYSVRLSGDVSSGFITYASFNPPGTSKLVLNGASVSSPFSSYSTSWLTQTLDAGCTTTANSSGRTCSALSGLAGIGILCYTCISLAIVCLGLALKSSIEAFVVARFLATAEEKKEDGGAALYASMNASARVTWALLFAAMLLIATALIAWAITVTAALGSIKDAMINNDYSVSLSDSSYTSYILFRPGTAWYFGLAALVLLVASLRSVVMHAPAAASPATAAPPAAIDPQAARRSQLQTYSSAK